MSKVKVEEDKARETFEKKKQEVLAKGKPFKAEFAGLKLGQGLNTLYEFLKTDSLTNNLEELIKKAEEACTT